MPLSVIPAKAVFQFFQAVADLLDPGFRQCDDFLRVHHDDLVKSSAAPTRRHYNEKRLALSANLFFYCLGARDHVIANLKREAKQFGDNLVNIKKH
jgi:hypothetical protein